MHRIAAVALVWAACNGGSTSTPDTPAPTGSDTASEEAEEAPTDRPRGDPQTGLRQGTVVLSAPPRPPLTLTVDLAETPQQRSKGLMFVEKLPEDRGMLFLFPNERQQSFWMENTLIPLDMFFIDAQWNVVGVVENAEPLTRSPRQVNGVSQYVLEVNAGFARQHGFGAGTQVQYTPPTP